MTRGPWLSAILAAGVLAATAACDYASNAGPPVAVCGQVLMASAATPFLQDVSSGSATVDKLSVAGDIFLKLAPGCDHGVTVTVDPAGAASVVNVAKAEDGKLAAIVLHPTTPDFEIRVGRPSGATDTLDVRIQPSDLGSS